MECDLMNWMRLRFTVHSLGSNESSLSPPVVCTFLLNNLIYRESGGSGKQYRNNIKIN